MYCYDFKTKFLMNMFVVIYSITYSVTNKCWILLFCVISYFIYQISCCLSPKISNKARCLAMIKTLSKFGSGNEVNSTNKKKLIYLTFKFRCFLCFYIELSYQRRPIESKESGTLLRMLDGQQAYPLDIPYNLRYL